MSNHSTHFLLHVPWSIQYVETKQWAQCHSFIQDGSDLHTGKSLRSLKTHRGTPGQTQWDRLKKKNLNTINSGIGKRSTVYPSIYSSTLRSHLWPGIKSHVTVCTQTWMEQLVFQNDWGGFQYDLHRRAFCPCNNLFKVHNTLTSG